MTSLRTLVAAGGSINCLGQPQIHGLGGASTQWYTSDSCCFSLGGPVGEAVVSPPEIRNSCKVAFAGHPQQRRVLPAVRLGASAMVPAQHR